MSKMVLKNLVDYVEREVNKTKASFNGSRDSIGSYITKYELGDYFGDKVPEEEKSRLKSSLEEKINDKFEKYREELDGILRKTGSKGTMGLAIVNDLFAYVSNVPLWNVTGLGYSLFALKTIIEAPALRRYLKKSHDWYGMGEHLLLKPIRYLLPVIGGYLEAGAFERMIRKRIINEVKADFIKEHGSYQSFEERIRSRLKQPVNKTIYESEPDTIKISEYREKNMRKAA
jgi:hypothetical protein